MFRKQLLYLTNDQLTAYRWARGGLSDGLDFPNDEAGWAAFSRHLAGSKNIPIYLLADLIEEDFQRDSLPHVLGRPRRALVQRRLDQHYRDTPYRQAIRQGREEHGRKDDRMLFSALTNAALLKPWLDAILKRKAPLTGIYSPALLSAALIKKLGLARDNLLLVTHQSGGLRQSFFQGAALKFSRLTPLADHNPDTVADATARETANTQQFLASTRLLPRGETLDAVILADGESLQRIRSACRDTPAMTHRFLDLADASTRLGLKNPAAVSLCEPLFLTLLGRVLPASHYALPEQTRFFKLWQARLALYVLSASIVTGALLSAGSDSLEALRHYRQRLQMEEETGVAQSQYQATARSLPHTAVSPQNMKTAVDIEQMISRNAPAPAQLLGIVSRALDTLPQIQINQLHWQVGAEDESTGSRQPAPQPGLAGKEPAPPATLIGIPKPPGQTLLIEGEVAPFGQHGHRNTLKNVNLFADELRKNKQVNVEITQLPFDIRPTEKLTGKEGNKDDNNKALFKLKLILAPEN